MTTYTPQNRRRKGRLTTQWRTGIGKSMRDRAVEDDDWKDGRIGRNGEMAIHRKIGMRHRL